MLAACGRFAALCLACLTCFLAAAPAIADDKPASCLYVEVASLPVKYVGMNMDPTIPGSINGQPARMLMDTGAAVTALTMRAAEHFDLSLSSTGQWVGGIGGDSRLYNARIDDITVGPTRSGRVNMRVIGTMGQKPAFDAIIGAKFLLQADLEIALADRQIKFFRPQNCKDTFLSYWTTDNVTVVPYAWGYTKGDNPHFKITLNGHELDAMIDSGADTTVVNLQAARAAGLRLDASDVKHLGYMAGVGEDHVDHWTARFDKLVIGDETILNAQIGVIESVSLHDVDILLGRDFLRSHRVLFASSQKKLYISYLGGDDSNAFVSHETKIAPWLQREADEGNPDAELLLSNWYGSGTNVGKDPAQAVKWLDRAAEHGQPRAQLAVGRRMMLQGRMDAAALKLRAALDALPDAYQGALWLYVARVRTNQAALGQQELDKTFKDDKNWPAPVAQFYLGRLDAAGLFAQAAAAKSPAAVKAQTCGSAAAAAELYRALGKLDDEKAVLAAHAECRPALRPAPVPAAAKPDPVAAPPQ